MPASTDLPRAGAALPARSPSPSSPLRQAAALRLLFSPCPAPTPSAPALRSPARASTSRKTNRPGPAAPRPAPPGPAAREEALPAPLQLNPPLRSDTSLRAHAAVRISPRVRHPRSKLSSSRFFSKRKPYQEPRPPPIFHRALEFELAASIRCATGHNRQSPARPLRFCREKGLNYFLAQLRRNSRPIVFHGHEAVTIFPRNFHIHMPASRRRVQRVYNQVGKNVVQCFCADGHIQRGRRRLMFKRDAFALRFGTQNANDFPRYF